MKHPVISADNGYEQHGTIKDQLIAHQKVSEIELENQSTSVHAITVLNGTARKHV